jgi:hypothetical protein
MATSGVPVPQLLVCQELGTSDRSGGSCRCCCILPKFVRHCQAAAPAAVSTRCRTQVLASDRPMTAARDGGSREGEKFGWLARICHRLCARHSCTHWYANGGSSPGQLLLLRWFCVSDLLVSTWHALGCWCCSVLGASVHCTFVEALRCTTVTARYAELHCSTLGAPLQ